MSSTPITSDLAARIRRGMVIPAHPLALDRQRKFDERRQRALTRYYLDAGAGGLAVGVHTTQFAIREPSIGLYKPVLELAAETADAFTAANDREVFKIAVVCGPTKQAVAEAETAGELGYHAVLLSLAALADEELPVLIEHAREVGEVMPLIGFYLQPAVGGRVLPYEFWRGFAEIDAVIAIKIAPFNRYQTFDVVRAVADAGREQAITLYTGNDDNIILDLLTPYEIITADGPKTLRITGGLLGHWAAWTQPAVQQLEEAHRIIDEENGVIQPPILTLAQQVTDANAAFFDSANAFAGCIAGMHEVLRRQGLLEGIECLDVDETLSPGQADEIDRVYRAYPHLNDDEFVEANLDRWLGD